MNTFLAESILSGASLETLEAMEQAVLNSTLLSTANGKPVHYRRSIFVPGDGIVLCLFEALDAIDIRDIYEAGEWPLTRIVEVTELKPTLE